MVRRNVLPVRQQDFVITTKRIRQLARQTTPGSRNQYLHMQSPTLV